MPPCIAIAGVTQTRIASGVWSRERYRVVSMLREARGLSLLINLCWLSLDNTKLIDMFALPDVNV